MLDTRHKLCTFILKNPPGETLSVLLLLLNADRSSSGCNNNYCPTAESNESGSASVKKEKEKKNRKKDKENGSGSGEAGNHDNFDAPQAVVGYLTPTGFSLPQGRALSCSSSLILTTGHFTPNC